MMEVAQLAALISTGMEKNYQPSITALVELTMAWREQEVTWGWAAVVSGGTDSDFKGYLADVAIWNTKLSHNDVLALYNATSGPYKSISGYLSLPPRVRLRTIDSATGSYPTIARTGDQNRLGNFPVRFDDTQTVEFTKTSYAYPQVLPGGSSIIEFPKSDLSIVRSGSAYAPPEHRILSDDYTRAYTLKPFDDSRIRLEEDEFYLTGTAVSVMPGFTSPLKNKTQITIDLQSTENTLVFLATGSVAGLHTAATPINSGLSYYNFEKKRWEIHGLTRHYETNQVSTASNINFLAGKYVGNRTNTRLDWMEATGSTQVISLRRSVIDAVYNNKREETLISQPAGQIVGHTGYPYARVFEPSGSQLLSMSNYITEPFLVEKMVYEFSGTFGTSGGDLGNGPEGINYSKFIVLRQGKVANPRILTKTLSGFVAYTPTAVDSFFGVNKDRDIVGFGDVTWTSVKLKHGRSDYE